LRRRGVALVAVAGILAAALTAAQLAHHGVELAGFRAALRATARLSLVLFLLAFVASSINKLKLPGGKLLLRYRKYLGNAFAASHFVHLATIFALIATHTAAFRAERTIGSLVPGMITYALIAAMVVTSFPRPAAALGRRRWLVLHKIGMYAIFAVFTVTSLDGFKSEPLYAFPLAALLVALALRAGAASMRWRARRSRR
jgi:DMSO/TMAO reductase YedYZ heme-binding membrane subunit